MTIICCQTKSTKFVKMSIENFFFLNILGEIQAAKFPLGPDGSGIFIRFDIVAGDDWEMVSGVKSGITQCANVGRNSELVVFNMPIECTFKSTNIHGCEFNFTQSLSSEVKKKLNFRATNCLQLVRHELVGH